jgi:hypothetical protein
MGTLVGPTGEFTIDDDGFRPGLGFSFSYRDKEFRFWFFVHVEPSGNNNVKKLMVSHPTTEQSGDIIPELPKSAVIVLEKNIERYFTTLDFIGSPRTSTGPSPTIVFNWHFRTPTTQ